MLSACEWTSMGHTNENLCPSGTNLKLLDCMFFEPCQEQETFFSIGWSQETDDRVNYASFKLFP